MVMPKEQSHCLKPEYIVHVGGVVLDAMQRTQIPVLDGSRSRAAGLGNRSLGVGHRRVLWSYCNALTVHLNAQQRSGCGSMLGGRCSGMAPVAGEVVHLAPQRCNVTLSTRKIPSRGVPVSSDSTCSMGAISESCCARVTGRLGRQRSQRAIDESALWMRLAACWMLVGGRSG